MSSKKFEEQQRFRQSWMYFVYSVLLVVLGLFIYADVKQIVFGQPFGEKPATNFILILVTLLIFTLLFLLYKIKLETLITNEGVYFRWVPFRKAYKRFSWNEIERAEVINYGFVGYGWHLTLYGTVYNVNGGTGLSLRLKTGKKIVLGTQKPLELANFLQQINRLH